MLHSRIQVELGFILQAGTCRIFNFAQNPRQSQSVQGTELNCGGDTAQKKCIPEGEGHRTYFLNRVLIGGVTLHIKTVSQYKLQVRLTAGWVAGPVILVPLRGSILQAETCKILSLEENPRWSLSVAISNLTQLT